MARSPLGTWCEAHARRRALQASLPLLLLACATEDGASTTDAGVQGAAEDAAMSTTGPKPEDAAMSTTGPKPEDASEATPSTPATETSIDDAAASPATDSSDALTDDSSTVAPAPLDGCVSELTLDDAGSDCYAGSYECSQGHAYLCTWDDTTGDACWQYAPHVTCPRWTESQCETALAELNADQPCNTDADCMLWGGLTADGACNIDRGEPVLSVSNLLPSSELDALRAAYNALLSRGCVENWGTDGTPHEATCEGGQCLARQESCLDFVDEPLDAGLDASTSARDSGVRDAAVQDAR